MNIQTSFAKIKNNKPCNLHMVFTMHQVADNLERASEMDASSKVIVGYCKLLGKYRDALQK